MLQLDILFHHHTNMHTLLGLLALIGFLASMFVHSFSMTGIDLIEAYPSLWLLHMGIFLVFIPFVMVLTKIKKLGPRLTLEDVKQGIPPIFIYIGITLMVYTILNFLISIPPEGQPYIEHGKYVLKRHGHIIREITQTQYIREKANLLRAFSGHWMLFYYVPMIYFFKRPAETRL